jgi:hypothetical protein
MPRPRAPLPRQLSSQPFSTAQALDVGVPPHLMRHRELARPLRGIRVSRDQDGLRARLRAYALHRQRDFAFSHTTAAELFGIPLPGGLSSDIHVSVPDPGRAPEIAGFVGHKLKRWDTAQAQGFPVTTAEQTWLDLAAMLDFTSLVVAGDYLVAGRSPLSSRTCLATAASEGGRRRGIARARLALEYVRPGSESPGESRLRILLVRSGLPEPRLNHTIVDTNGGFIARVDLAYQEARIALEYEGDIHRTDQSVWRRDIRRREVVEDLGWRMVRVTADDLRAPDDLLNRVRHLLRTR